MVNREMFQFVTESFIHINVYDILLEKAKLVAHIKTNIVDDKIVLTLSSFEEFNLNQLIVLCEKMNKIKSFYESERERLIKFLFPEKSEVKMISVNCIEEVT